jgi:hypothetical protein
MMHDGGIWESLLFILLATFTHDSTFTQWIFSRFWQSLSKEGWFVCVIIFAVPSRGKALEYH